MQTLPFWQTIRPTKTHEIYRKTCHILVLSNGAPIALTNEEKYAGAILETGI
ncbi:MAG: hypothetical protein NZM38_08085 [Cytophagales bacterium]|nr:hypothetical protein [Cytophagales bacterium]MDW8384716.1 hypothetical protein [Flammeovirgaceae bacterium]